MDVVKNVTSSPWHYCDSDFIRNITTSDTAIWFQLDVSVSIGDFCQTKHVCSVLLFVSDRDQSIKVKHLVVFNVVVLYVSDQPEEYV